MEEYQESSNVCDCLNNSLESSNEYDEEFCIDDNDMTSGKL